MYSTEHPARSPLLPFTSYFAQQQLYQNLKKKNINLETPIKNKEKLTNDTKNKTPYKTNDIDEDSETEQNARKLRSKDTYIDIQTNKTQTMLGLQNLFYITAVRRVLLTDNQGKLFSYQRLLNVHKNRE